MACWTNRSARIGVSVREPMGALGLECPSSVIQALWMDEAFLFPENRDQAHRLRKCMEDECKILKREET